MIGRLIETDTLIIMPNR